MPAKGQGHADIALSCPADRSGGCRHRARHAVEPGRNNPALLYLSALLGLIAGIALVLAHNVWAADWRVIITLIGWISIVDSASWILFPQQLRQLYEPLMTNPNLALYGGLITLAAGAVLSYVGYAAKSAGRRK
jgi:hypothetical protein